MKWFIRGIEAISIRIGNMAAYCIPAMMVVTSYEVVMRYLFKAPTIWALETTEYLFLASTALGGAIVYQRKAHINVSVLYDRLPPKAQALLEILTSIFFFALVGVLLWHATALTSEAVIGLQHSPSYWAPPIYPVYIIMTLGVLLMVIQGIANLMRNILILAGRPYEPISSAKPH